MTTQMTTLSVPDLLRRLSSHLDSLAAEVHAVEVTIGDEMGVGSALEAGSIKRLQRLDYLRQSLEDLALLNHFMADQSSGEVAESVGSRLRLATTKTLLKPEPPQLQPVLTNSADGNVDLF